MIKSNKFVLAGLLGISALTTLPTAALAHDRWGREERYDDDDRGDARGYRYGGGDRGYYQEAPRYVNQPVRRCRSGGTTGLIVGGALGALVGRGLDRSGDRAMGTILGAGGGALIGHQIERNRNCR